MCHIVIARPVEDHVNKIQLSCIKCQARREQRAGEGGCDISRTIATLTVAAEEGRGVAAAGRWCSYPQLARHGTEIIVKVSECLNR
jgi:hypothetical protein